MALRVWGIAAVCAAACTACAGASAQPVPSAAPPPTVLHDVGVASSVSSGSARFRIPPKPQGAGAYLMVRLRRTLHTPYGNVRPKTLFGDPLWLPVVAHRGPEATVLAPVRPHARAVPLDLRGLALRWTSVRVVVDLAAGSLRVVRDGRALGSFPIGSGTPATPTPTGRFFVTDRLRFPAGSPYAPLAFALAAHQTHLAPGWPGGDLVAIHPGAMGAVSNGCIHVGLPALALLRRVVPLGTIVVVR